MGACLWGRSQYKSTSYWFDRCFTEEYLTYTMMATIVIGGNWSKPKSNEEKPSIVCGLLTLRYDTSLHVVGAVAFSCQVYSSREWDDPQQRVYNSNISSFNLQANKLWKLLSNFQAFPSQNNSRFIGQNSLYLIISCNSTNLQDPGKQTSSSLFTYLKEGPFGSVHLHVCLFTDQSGWVSISRFIFHAVSTTKMYSNPPSFPQDQKETSFSRCCMDLPSTEPHLSLNPGRCLCC